MWSNNTTAASLLERSKRQEQAKEALENRHFVALASLDPLLHQGSVIKVPLAVARVFQSLPKSDHANNFNQEHLEKFPIRLP